MLTAGDKMLQLLEKAAGMKINSLFGTDVTVTVD